MVGSFIAALEKDLPLTAPLLISQADEQSKAIASIGPNAAGKQGFVELLGPVSIGTARMGTSVTNALGTETTAPARSSTAVAAVTSKGADEAFTQIKENVY